MFSAKSTIYNLSKFDVSCYVVQSTSSMQSMLKLGIWEHAPGKV